MSYTPTTWAAGDTVTSAKLNKIEQGITNAGVLVVNVNVDIGNNIATLDRTWQEINDAVFAVVQMPLNDINGKGFYNINAISENDGNYVIMIDDLDTFGTNSPNGYPTTALPNEQEFFYEP